nr:unnamed protein product [Callosobruchus analis]
MLGSFTGNREASWNTSQLDAINQSTVLGKRLCRPSSLESTESRYDRIDHLVAEQDQQTR